MSIENDQTNKPSNIRLLIMSGAFVLLFFVLVVRLGMIQLSGDTEYNESIDTQSIRIIRIPSVRGQILSSDNIVIADSIPSYDIVFHLAEMRKYGSRDKNVDYILDLSSLICSKIGRKTDISKEDIIEQMNLFPAMPITVFSSLNDKELAIASEMSPPIQGVEIVVVPKRFYPYGPMACHILGYVGHDDPGEAPDKKKYSYYIPDIKGKSGLEKLLDSNITLGANYNGLRGSAGSKLVRVNVKGYVHDDLGITELPINGNSVSLTIDWKAQKAAEQILKGKKGAIVVLNARTGAVLVMASAPSYDSNIFTNGIPKKGWNELMESKDKPLMNRPLMGEFLPGSIIKPLVALAELKDRIGREETVFCDGAVKIGNSRIRCWAWNYGGHGSENMINAIRDSCNVYFVTMGIRLGLDNITDMYKHAGIGRKTGIELSERTGIIPSRELKLKIEKTPWTNFDTGLISMGQGMISITPIQAAVYTAAIANGGKVLRPYLVNSIYNNTGKLLFENSPQVIDHLPITQAQIDVIKEGMHNVVYDPNGSGKRAKNDFIELYGKTGTAQIGPPDNRTKCTWFIGFGYLGKEAYSICVFVEGGLAGGMTNAPMTKAFFETWIGTDTAVVESSIGEKPSTGEEFIPAD
ncbi:MAG: penicillin-binding protein 2 [Lentisphaerota bacterium]